MKIYGAYNKDEEIRKKSTSGGMFALLSQYVFDRGGIVFGARFDKQFNVIHDYCEKKEDIDVFRGSKYVQSYLGNTLEKVKEFLENDRYVLFTGTPCQVSALRNFLKKEYNKLITCDLICYGTPKARVWKDYLNYLTNDNKDKIKSINFREKINGWKKSVFTIQFEDGKKYSFKSSKKDYFLWLFYHNYALTPSCYDCKYASINRIGDFSIGDFWGVEERRPKLFDNKGTSLIFINNNKAEEIFETIKEKMIFEEVTIEEAMQKKLQQGESKPKDYMEFWNEYEREGFVVAVTRARERWIKNN